MAINAYTLTVVFNNIPGRSDLQTAHGFACLIEGRGRTVLFDTGCDGTLLLENMAKLGKNPADVETIVISHMHWDHTGGLFQFLHVNPAVTVYLPSSCARNFQRHVERLGARAQLVPDPTEIADGILSTGTMELPDMAKEMKEQSLVFDGPDGGIVLTGCAHPGIVAIAERAASLGDGRLSTVLGGFHLVDKKADEIDAVAESFRRLSIDRVGASHCTGKTAIAAFEDRWSKKFVPFGLGTVYPLSA